jgi:hypothetical protein
MARLKPEATYLRKIGRHMLKGEKWHGLWVWTCRSWPALAEAHSGSPDSGPIVEEFERRATGQGQAPAGQPAAGSRAAG